MHVRDVSVVACVAAVLAIGGCAKPRGGLGADPAVGPPAAVDAESAAAPDVGAQIAQEQVAQEQVAQEQLTDEQRVSVESGDAAVESDAAQGVQEAPADARVVTLAEGLRVDLRARRVEIDGFVPIDVRNPRVPRVFLEVLLCRRDSREHETLVVTDVRPSLVHAGLLLLGQEAGDPGAWRFEGDRAVLTPPTGSGLDVLVRVDRDGAMVEEPLASWARSADGARLMGDAGAGFVFAGSRFVRQHVEANSREVYVADGAGTIVGLSTFGDEVIAWTGEHHPDTAVMAPAWIADPARVPAVGTPVTVVLVPAAKP